MVRQDSNSRGSVVVVEEIFVEPDAREVGVGEALLDSAEQWASERGAMGIEIEALPGDRKLKNLGERHGFKARTLVMHKKLN
jgi:GNAT superfamily N-acetyltransferase